MCIGVNDSDVLFSISFGCTIGFNIIFMSHQVVVHLTHLSYSCHFLVIFLSHQAPVIHANSLYNTIPNIGDANSVNSVNSFISHILYDIYMNNNRSAKIH